MSRNADPLPAPAASSSLRCASTWKFTQSHEYALVDGKAATVGITDFAQSALGDVSERPTAPTPPPPSPPS